MICVVDSSIVLAALLGEPGEQEAGDALAAGFISPVNLAEVVTVMRRRGLTEEDARRALALLDLRVLAFDRDQAIAAGFLDDITSVAGLSLGDRACLALARSLRAEVVTADRAWTRIADAVGVSVRLIR